MRAIFGFDSRVVFLYAGNLHSFKGVADIVRAAALLPEDASFVCVFVGPEEPANKDGATIEHFMQTCAVERGRASRALSWPR